MPKKRLTEEGVKKLKATPGKQLRYFDQGLPGLVLRVSWGGKKTWQALHYVQVTNGETGKKRTEARSHKLGHYPILKLADAREKARKFLADPKAALAEEEAATFKQVAENFIKRHVDANNLISKPEIERCLERYIYPKWGERPFEEIRRRDVTELLDEIQDGSGFLKAAKLKGGPRQADVVLAIVSKIMRWHASRTDDYLVPLAPGMRRYNAGDRKGKRILDDREIATMWAACGDLGTFGRLVKVALLTAQRRDKVAHMRRDDLDQDTWLIRLDHEREKSHATSLKLPQVALDIIKAQPNHAANPFVFAGSARGQRRKSVKLLEPPAFNSWSECKTKLDAKMRETLPEMPRWTIHDLRRTGKSLMSRAGVRPDISERVLGHAISGVEGTYDRHSYASEKAEALKQLAALIDTITSPPTANVVAIVGRKKRAAR